MMIFIAVAITTVMAIFPPQLGTLVTTRNALQKSLLHRGHRRKSRNDVDDDRLFVW